jgi:hypothetical protein
MRRLFLESSNWEAARKLLVSPALIRVGADAKSGATYRAVG